MSSENDVPPEQWVKKAVVFRTGPEHEECWHTQAGITSGLVLRIVPTLAQKAELLAAEGIVLPEMAGSDEPEVLRLWVRADPSPKIPSRLRVRHRAGMRAPGQLLIPVRPPVLLPSAACLGIFPPPGARYRFR
jgi:hypothetical protein